MVQVDEHDREFVVVALRPVNLRLQDKTHVPRVIQRRAIVGDGQLVNSLHVPGVLQRNGREIRERLEQLQVPRIKPFRPDAIDQLDDPQAGVAKPHRHRHNRLRLRLGLLVHLREKSRVLGGIRHHHGFPVLCDPPRDSLPHLDAHVLQRLRRFSHGQFKVQLLFSFIQQQKRPIVRAQKLIDLLHNCAENLIELQGGRQCLPQLLEDGDLPLFPLPGGHREIAAALHGRKLLYFFHVWLNPVLFILTALPSSPSGGACPGLFSSGRLAKYTNSSNPRRHWRFSASIGSSQKSAQLARSTGVAISPSLPLFCSGTIYRAPPALVVAGLSRLAFTPTRSGHPGWPYGTERSKPRLLPPGSLPRPSSPVIPSEARNLSCSLGLSARRLAQ